MIMNTQRKRRWMMDDIGHYMVRVSNLSKENKRLHTLNRDLLAALKEAERFIGDELYDAVESFQNDIYIDECQSLLDKVTQAIAEAEGGE
jgi:hypothetical protein